MGEAAEGRRWVRNEGLRMLLLMEEEGGVLAASAESKLGGRRGRLSVVGRLWQ